MLGLAGAAGGGGGGPPPPVGGGGGGGKRGGGGGGRRGEERRGGQGRVRARGVEVWGGSIPCAGGPAGRRRLGNCQPTLSPPANSGGATRAHAPTPPTCISASRCWSRAKCSCSRAARRPAWLAHKGGWREGSTVSAQHTGDRDVHAAARACRGWVCAAGRQPPPTAPPPRPPASPRAPSASACAARGPACSSGMESAYSRLHRVTAARWRRTLQGEGRGAGSAGVRGGHGGVDG